MIILVTRTAVSVVICIAPSLRPWKPFCRSSDVLSTNIKPQAEHTTSAGSFYPEEDHLLTSDLDQYSYTRQKLCVDFHTEYAAEQEHVE